LKFLDNLCSQREKLYFQPILTTQKLHELLSFKKAQSQQPSCNVTVEEDIQQCVAKTVAAFGGISTLVNNVGWGVKLTTTP
jgi:NAD(P)-dependent dehydrogenase (short-subunit alcohol dehydrogenase family)